ncbi:metallophosphoesterase family protein [Vagococcus sp.]|uniref:metallophosphoesterase family protein n=1 Tax=Vagococcus sp. TaxID=1933889 RepID=UPI003F9DA1AB
MKLIHVADLHLDQSFSGIISEQSMIKSSVQHANQQTFTSIINECMNQSIDVLLITGDTFHQPKISIQTQRFFIEQLLRLKEADIKVVLSFGNHDFYSELRYWFEWPENVVLFENEAVETKIITSAIGEKLAISGFSYQDRWLNTSKTASYPPRNQEVDYHIGFYHGEIAQEGHYAPFQVSELAKDYDYWALGHIHAAQVVSKQPLAIYPGTPQGHHRKEDKVKGVVFLELSAGVKNYQWLPVANIVWKTKQYDLNTEITQRKEVLTWLLDQLQGLSLNAPLTVLSASLKVTDESVIAFLQEDEDSLLGYLQEELLKQTKGKLWLSRLTCHYEHTQAFVMGFDSSLIDDLSQGLMKPERFAQQGQDLLRNDVIAKYLRWDESDIQEVIEKSSQLIKNDIDFGDEVTH